VLYLRCVGERIAVVGDVGLDVTFVTANEAADEKVAISTTSRGVGGTGANTSAALMTLGDEVTLCATVGNDAIGDDVRRELSAQGLAVDRVRRLPGRTSIAVISIEANGRRRVLVDPGVGFDIDAGAATPFECAAVVLTQIDHKIAVDLAAAFPGARVVLAIERRHLGSPDWVDALPEVWLTVTNEAGAGLLPQTLVGRSRAVVVTMGERGARWRARDQEFRVRARSVPVRDATGAGDVFVAALVHFLLAQRPPELAMGLAATAASIAIQQLGAERALPTEAQVLAAS
jgi:ribokinase